MIYQPNIPPRIQSVSAPPPERPGCNILVQHAIDYWSYYLTPLFPPVYRYVYLEMTEPKVYLAPQIASDPL